MLYLLLALTTMGTAAQHPCDVTYPTVYRVPAAQLKNLRVGFCFARTDTEGVPITEEVTFSMQINAGPEINLGVLQPVSAPNAAGDAFYQFTNANLAAGVITIKASTVLLGMSASSAPITLTLLGSPKTPTDLNIIRVYDEGEAKEDQRAASHRR